jgi:hypothetical protein
LRQVFSNSSYEHLKLNEGNFVSIITTVLKVGGIGEHVLVEETTNRGRIDMTIPDKIYIIEFKFNNTQDSIKQILNRKYAEKYVNMKLTITLVGIKINMKVGNENSRSIVSLTCKDYKHVV